MIFHFDNILSAKPSTRETTHTRMHFCIREERELYFVSHISPPCFLRKSAFSGTRVFNPHGSPAEIISFFNSRISFLRLPGLESHRDVDHSRLVFALREYYRPRARTLLQKETKTLLPRGRAYFLFPRESERATIKRLKAGDFAARDINGNPRDLFVSRWIPFFSLSLPPFPSGIIISLRFSHACHHAHADSARASRVRSRVPRNHLPLGRREKERERPCNAFTQRLDASVSSRRLRAHLRKYLIHGVPKLTIRLASGAIFRCSIVDAAA